MTLALVLGWLGGAAAAQYGGCEAIFDNVPPALNACADTRRLRVALVGDVLLHSPLQRRGYAEGFGAIWGAATPFFRAADIAVANLEGPVAAGFTRGGGQRADPGAVFDNVVHTSYPMFNYHAQVITDLQAAGVDLVTTANNHALDRFSGGADATIAALQAAGMAFTGTVRAGAPRQFATFTQTPLGRIVWIGCTYDTNGIPDTARQVLGCYGDRAALLDTVRAYAARPEVAGIVVLPHWGNEYSQRPDSRQTALARDLAAAGATMVVGTHPHVVQPWEVLPGPAGQVPVVYSTGNFVSGQPSLVRETGMLAWMELCRAAPGPDLARAIRSRLVVARAGWVPLRMARHARGPELFGPGSDGVPAYVAPAQAVIERLVPGRDMGARLVCREVVGTAETADPALTVFLQ